MTALEPQELALVLRHLRADRDVLKQRIEMQKSQRRRGLPGATVEVSKLEHEFTLLDAAIHKLWANK